MGLRKTDPARAQKQFAGAFGKVPIPPAAVRARGGNPDKGSEYNKLKMGMIRYHKKTSGTAAANIAFFNAAKTANVCNNEVAGKLGDWNKLISNLFFILIGSDAVAAITDIMKVAYNAEIDLVVSGVKYLDKVPMLPYLVPLGPSGYGPVHDTSYSDPWTVSSGGWDVPEIDVAYRANESIELNVVLNTAPSAAVQIVACLLGPEWVRGDRA